jgi:hypothetical protein
MYGSPAHSTVLSRTTERLTFSSTAAQGSWSLGDELDAVGVAVLEGRALVGAEVAVVGPGSMLLGGGVGVADPGRLIVQPQSTSRAAATA